MQNARIIVIGAGISGISAAAKLIENGFKNLIVLEAENRFGGRVHTVPFGDNVLDMGAQWCHGEKNNSIHELVKDHNILDQSAISYPNVSFYSSSGQQVDNSKCGRLMALCLDILEHSEDDLKSYKGSLGSYVITKYQEELRSCDYSDIDEETRWQVLDYFHKFENSIEASDNWFITSGNGYLQYWECEGHPLLNWKDKGYKSAIDFITKKLPDPSRALDVESKILLNKEVVNISWSDASRDHITVKCSDGSSYDSDHVIVTVSLGVLKENFQTLFSPTLPALKINAIEGLSIGAVDKIYLEFEKPFWDETWAGFSLLWTQKDSEAIRGTENAWLEDVFGFYRVDYQPNILCGWIGGTSARAMEKLDEATVLKGCVHLLDKFLGNQLPWTKPVNMIRSTWYSNKHFRGSYSFRSLTSDLLRTSANDLAHPLYSSLGKPTLLFGGEATSEHYYSTVHGALEAGQREAQRLTDYYSNKPHKISSLKLPSELKHYDTIVLGAGISGLGAGKILKEADMNFVILEGSDRVGGRINTVVMLNLIDNRDDKFSKVFVDAGAQWLHGKNNELFKFAEKLNLIRTELSEEGQGDFMREDGVKLDDFFVKKVDFKIGQILEECEKFAEKKCEKSFQFPSSIEEFVEQKFRKFLEDLETENQKEQAIQLLDWHQRFQIIDNSCMRFDDISAKDWGNYSFNGESCQTHINISNGMGTIVDKLFDSLQNNIELNKTVDLILWEDDNCHRKTKIIRVRCSDGSVFTTNNLICTFSLGVLKENHLHLFSPLLPASHRRVIENIGFGTINKIFLRFEEKWWNDDWKGLQLVWKKRLDDNSHWTQYISGFDVIHPEPDNTLLAWIGGQGAIDMEKLTDKVVADECMKLMRKFMNNTNLPNPTQFYCSRWNSQELIKGAYSFTSKNTDRIQDWEKILSLPITSNGNLILLAGEHCNEQYFSTVHGAFLSGQKEAQRLIEQAEKIKKLQRNCTQNSSCISKL